MVARRLPLPDGRTLAFDDVGDRAGAPVVYLHGTPDSRLSRHPDDSIAGALGVRLLAVDRPGFGETSGHADRDRLGLDLGALLDALGCERVALLGWSSGGLAALAAAAVLGRRVARVVLVGTLPPVEAYAEPAVLGALGAGRRSFVELALELGPDETAAEVVPHLVPDPLTPELAREHVLDGATGVGRRELEAVPGAVDRLAAGLQAGVARGVAGIEQDLRHQLQAGLPLAAVEAPVLLVHGEHDEVAPPAVGHWLAARLPDATVEVVPDAGHHVLFPRWPALLRTAARQWVPIGGG